MSTRANISIESKKYHEELWFYRHSDGYPEGTLPALKTFMQWVSEGKIRDNVSQSAGWLIMIGAKEYETEHSYKDGKWIEKKKETLVEPIGNNGYGWKVGAFEPTIEMHGDIEYLYEVDLDKREIRVYDVEYTEPNFEVSKGKLLETVTDFS